MEREREIKVIIFFIFLNLMVLTEMEQSVYFLKLEENFVTITNFWEGSK